MPGDSRVGGKIKDVRLVVARTERKRAQVEDTGNQDDAVDRNAAFRSQIFSKRDRAKRAIAFADQEFGRIPAIIAADIGVDEQRERFNVLIDAPKVLVLRFANSMAEARANRIDEDEVGPI